jgi:hypothetical protein
MFLTNLRGRRSGATGVARRAATAALVLAAAALPVAAAAGPAAAADTVTSPAAPGTSIPAGGLRPADWNGNCTWDLSYNNADWGVCGGSGPQQYVILVGCSDGYWYRSDPVTFGDPNGAWAVCPSGTVRTGYGWSRW